MSVLMMISTDYGLGERTVMWCDVLVSVSVSVLIMCLKVSLFSLAVILSVLECTENCQTMKYSTTAAATIYLHRWDTEQHGTIDHCQHPSSIPYIIAIHNTFSYKIQKATINFPLSSFLGKHLTIKTSTTWLTNRNGHFPEPHFIVWRILYVVFCTVPSADRTAVPIFYFYLQYSFRMCLFDYRIIMTVFITYLKHYKWTNIQNYYHNE